MYAALRTWMGGEQKRFCLHWPAFILAFAVGLLYVYLTAPMKRSVVVFPTPFNAGQVVYEDDAGTCFKYKAIVKDCPTDLSLIERQPVTVENNTMP